MNKRTSTTSVASCVAKLTFERGGLNRKVFSSSNSLLNRLVNVCSRVGSTGNLACPSSSNYFSDLVLFSRFWDKWCVFQQNLQNSNLRISLLTLTKPQNVLTGCRNQQLFYCAKNRISEPSFLKKLLPCLMQSSVKFYRMFPDEGSCDITVTTWSKYSCVFTRNLEKLFPTAAIWKGKTLWNSAASYQHLKPLLLCIGERVVKRFPRWMEDWMVQIQIRM